MLKAVPTTVAVAAGLTNEKRKANVAKPSEQSLLDSLMAAQKKVSTCVCGGGGGVGGVGGIFVCNDLCCFDFFTFCFFLFCFI
jgi:hypothetical protein